MSNIAEVAVPYAVLALHDDDVEITEANLQAVLSAANIEVDPIWLSLFAKAMTKETVKSLLTSFESAAGSAAPVAAAAGAPAAAAAPAAAGKKEEKKVEEEEEEMGLGLFD
jgi:large subunit ribosomal protein LP1